MDSDSPGSYWQVIVILPKGREVVVLRHDKDKIALPLYEKLSALIEPLRKDKE